MSARVRAVVWPIVSLLVIGGTHLIAEAIRPSLHDVVVPAVAMPIYLLIGGWSAFAVIRAGGTFVEALGAGAALGLMPAALQLVGFGLLLGHDSDSVTTSAIFGFVAVVWGATVGGGIASSLDRSAQTQRVAEPVARAADA